jgi:hypothetical protein
MAEVDLAAAVDLAVGAPHRRAKDRIADLIQLRGMRDHAVASDSWIPSPTTVEN